MGMPENPAAMSGTTLSCNDVHVQVGRREILRGIDITLSPGHLTAVVGPNGAGKSTLVRTLLGMTTPTRGHLELDGRPLASYSREELARLVSFIPQDTQIDFSFRVEDVVLMGRYPHLGPLEPEGSADLRAAVDALEELELTALAQRDVTSLSVGERQLTVIARAFATQGSVLIADEPVAALDIGHRLRVLDLLRARASAGRTVVAVLHDLELALRYADEVLLIDDGRLAASGAPREVLAGPALAQAFGVKVEMAPNGESLVCRRRT